jgi:hypothetical protein
MMDKLSFVDCIQCIGWRTRLLSESPGTRDRTTNFSFEPSHELKYAKGHSVDLSQGEDVWFKYSVHVGDIRDVEATA